jgi:uncharacterized RDD family membrane protein YckC
VPAPPSAAVPAYASWPRRIIALFVDWIISTLVVIGFVGPHAYAHDPASRWLVLGVFAVEVAVLTALAAGSFGQLLAGIRVLTTEGRPLNLLLSVVRTLLICVVIPPLIFRSDSGRGLHDLAVGSATYVR